MKRALLACVILAAAGASTAAGGVDAKQPVRLWNPETVVTVTGTVESVDPVAMGDGFSAVRLQLRTTEGLLQVRVGPSWWVAERKIAFAKGDRLQVKGSRLVFSGEAAIVAAEIQRGAERMVLRDGAGKPAWAGR